MPFFPRKISEPSGVPAIISQWFTPRIRPVLAPMSFYAAPTFPPVPTMVGYNTTLATTSVALSTPLAPPMSLPTMAAALDGKTVDLIPAPAFQSTDPVTKAVMDNIMGKLPTKKPAISCKCETCGLEFSGQVVLETHLAGAKHAKKLKSLEILKQLQNSGQSFSRDEKSKILKCEICDVVVNSSQQLQTHLSGSKHKQKVGKKLIKSNAPTSTSSNGGTNSTSGSGDEGAPINNGSNATNPLGAAMKKDDSPSGQKAPNVAAALKVNKYVCETCNMCLNSEIQLEQHVTSRKHKDRLSGRLKKRPAPYWKFRGGYSGRGKKIPMSVQYSQPLSANFVGAGSTML